MGPFYETEYFLTSIL